MFVVPWRCCWNYQFLCDLSEFRPVTNICKKQRQFVFCIKHFKTATVASNATSRQVVRFIQVIFHMGNRRIWKTRRRIYKNYWIKNLGVNKKEDMERSNCFTLLLLLLLLISSSSSLLSALYRVFTIIYLQQTVFIGYILLQLFCIYRWCDM